LYLYVLEAYRRKGVAGALLKGMIRQAKRLDRKLYLRIIKENDYADVLKKLADQNNFQENHVTHIYSSGSKQDFHHHWMELVNSKGEKVYQKLLQKGYETKSFDSVPDEVLQRLKKEIGVKFPHYLNPFTLSDRNDEWSFITFQGNKPVAYSAATLIGKKLIFQQLASGYDYLYQGVFFLPVYCFINNFFKKPVDYMNCIVLADNRHMNKVFKVILG